MSTMKELKDSKNNLLYSCFLTYRLKNMVSKTHFLIGTRIGSDFGLFRGILSNQMNNYSVWDPKYLSYTFIAVHHTNSR